MTTYAASLQDRFAQELRALRMQVRRLQQRTGAIDSGMPLALLPAKVDPAWSGSGSPDVFINGSATATTPVQWLASYTPAAGDQVLVAPLPATAVSNPRSYVILGKLL